MNVKQLDHLNLSVRDLDEAASFYAKLFDFDEVERGDSRGTPYRILKSGDVTTGPRGDHYHRFHRGPGPLLKR